MGTPGDHCQCSVIVHCVWRCNTSRQAWQTSDEEKSPGDQYPGDDEQLRALCQNGALELSDTWTIWYDTGGKKGKTNGEEWETQMVSIGSFSTVVGLWNYWNAIDISRLPNGGNVRWMKEPIRPTWEDPANANGGRLLVRHTDNAWGEQALMDVLLWIIGVACGSERYDDICGFVFSRRRAGKRVEVWTRDSS